MNEQEAQLAVLGLRDSLRNANYFSLLAERDRRYKLGVNITTTLGALVAAAFAGISIFANAGWVPWVGLVSGLLAGSTSVVGVVFDFSARSVRASELAKQSAVLAAEWRTLLLRYSYNESEKYEVEDLQRRQKEIEAPVSGDLPYIQHLSARAEQGAQVRVVYELYGESVNGDGKGTRVEGEA